MASGKHAYTAVFWGGLGVLCFSGTAPATKVAAPFFGPVILTGARIVIAALLGIVTLLVLRQHRWPGRQYVPSLLVTGLGLAVGYPLFLALAMQEAPAYHGAVVIGLVPAATAALAAVRTSERLPPRFWVSCLIGFGAVLTFALVNGGGLHVADLWLVLAVLSCAVGYVEGARVTREIGAIRMLSWAMILLSPFAAIAVLATVAIQPLPVPTTAAWIGLIYTGVASMWGGSMAWYRAMAIGGTSRIGQLNLAQPFLGITWSGLLLGEAINWTVPTTAVVIVACMAVCVTTTSAKTREPSLASPRA